MDKAFKNEADFLSHYDPSAFEKLSLTTDILMLSVSDGEKENYRKLPKKYFSVLLVKRDTHPFLGKWCLPGGFVGIRETLEEAAARVLKQETNLTDIYMEQLYTFGAPDRDPRMRIVSVSYMALVDKNKLVRQLHERASWFHCRLSEEDNVLTVHLDNGREAFEVALSKTLCHDTVDSYSYSVLHNEQLAFDHALLLAQGIARLKNKIQYTDIVFNMIPAEFTLGELQQVFEVILGKELLDPAFRRMIGDRVEKTGRFKTGGGHRPSALFRYRKKVF